MSGHSKWATTKRHKAVIDAKRGKIFSVLAKELTLAARSGGGDQASNAKLRTLLVKARTANMPTDNIERAVKKGTGELPGVSYEEIVYEGYAPGGIGVIVEVTTDNKNRAVGEVRSAFTKAGGSLAAPGALAFNFQRKGQFLIGAEATKEDVLMEVVLDAGADDVIDHGDHFEVLCNVPEYDAVAKALEDKGIKPESSEIAYLPNNTVPVKDPAAVKSLLRLIETLDALDDVKAVHANHEIDESLLPS
ncbi:MAG: YebC/PmpR family DNA-binding transcriptional regulator [Puniceicoccales bacterium]|jgi:YebC/PmpR family DNA-binding regulatory protein|nr:YebC/PmpR family DNA-binding transcriptional regulator [Puniceicoccales bacterium]